MDKNEGLLHYDLIEAGVALEPENSNNYKAVLPFHITNICKKYTFRQGVVQKKQPLSRPLSLKLMSSKRKKPQHANVSAAGASRYKIRRWGISTGINK